MKAMQTALMIAAVALASGCAGNMQATRGEFSVNGYTNDPITATAVAGGVTTNQYRAETDRVVALKMLDKGMHPGYGYGAYGQYGYGVGPTGGDYWYYYRSRGIVPYVQQPAVPTGAVTVVPGGQPGGYATQQDLQRVEEKADDGLCLHWKQKNPGKPLTDCPLKKK